MKKRIVTISALVLILLLALFAFTACNASTDVGEELIKNGNFSSWDGDTKTFDGWSTVTGVSGFTFGVQYSGDDANPYLYIDNSSKLYTYVKQTVKVDTNRIYKVSVDFYIENAVTHDYGAYVAFLENTSHYFVAHKDVTVDSEGQTSFVKSTFYVRPRNTDYLTLALCLGSADNGAQGRVCFDNVSMSRVEDVPEGFSVINFKKAKTVNGNTNADGIAFVTVLTIMSAALLISAYILLRRMYAKRNVFSDFGVVGTPVGAAPKVKWYQNTIFIACIVAAVAFVIRLIVMLTTYGLGREMTSTIMAADELAKSGGVSNYVASHPTTTLAPGAMYILAIIGAITKSTSYYGASVVLRLINVLADVATVLMIFFYGKKRVGNKLAAVFSGLYALLPFAFSISSIQGTFESLLTALIVASLILMVEKQYLATYFVMTLASVLDIRALAVAPIIVAYFVYMYIKDDASIKKITSHRLMISIGLVATIVLAYLLTLPVGINQIKAGEAFFNFKVMVNEMANNNIFAGNAFNLYSMVALNGKTTQTSVNVLNLIFILVLEAFVISLYFKNRNKQELILLASFTLAVISVFTVKVNYTYLFLSIALGIIYTMISGDKRMYAVISGYSVLGMLGFGQLVNQSGVLGVTPNAVDITKSSTWGPAVLNFETQSAFLIVFSVFAVILTGYYVYVTYSITNNTKIVDIKGLNEPIGKAIKRNLQSVKSRFARRSED